MARVLRGAGKTVEVLPLKGEDHWLSHFEYRKKALQASVDFVTKYNPPDLAP
jgi:dipeptidyl aminopeptidase/acylaminoacyl peptidase